MFNLVSANYSRGVRYSKALIGLRSSDVWLASYPRSGNSWFRLIVSEYLKLLEGHSGGLTTNLDLEMPVFGFTDLRLEWEHENFPRIIKSHLNYNYFLRKPSERILLVRNPVECLPSYYRLLQANKSNPYSQSFSAFLRSHRYGVAKYINHFHTWSARKGPIVYYEDLQKDAVEVFGSLLGQLNLDVDVEQVREAVAAASLENVKKLENEGGVREKYNRFSEGFVVTGGSLSEDRKKLFTSMDVEYIQDAISSVPSLKHYVENIK